MAPRHEKNTPIASVRGTVSLEPELAFLQVQNFKKEGSAYSLGTPRSSKTDIGSYVNRARENRQKKGDYAENFIVFPWKGCLRAQILPYSLRVDPQVWNFKKNSPSARKNTPTTSVRGAVSLEPMLHFSQVWNFKEEGIASFPGIPRSSKTDIGSYVNRARENWRKLEKRAENLTRFSSRTAAFMSRFFLTRYELICKFRTLRKTATLATTCNSRFADNVSRLAGIFTGKT